MAGHRPNRGCRSYLPICGYAHPGVPISAGLLGLLNSFRMMREPEAPPAAPGTTPGLL